MSPQFLEVQEVNSTDGKPMGRVLIGLQHVVYVTEPTQGRPTRFTEIISVGHGGFCQTYTNASYDEVAERVASTAKLDATPRRDDMAGWVGSFAKVVNPHNRHDGHVGLVLSSPDRDGCVYLRWLDGTHSQHGILTLQMVTGLDVKPATVPPPRGHVADLDPDTLIGIAPCDDGSDGWVIMGVQPDPDEPDKEIVAPIGDAHGEIVYVDINDAAEVLRTGKVWKHDMGEGESDTQDEAEDATTAGQEG